MAHQNKDQNTNKQEKKDPTVSKFYHLFGFDLVDLSGWSQVITLLHRPTDPSSLGIFRLVFGLLMILDIPFERGLGQADQRFSDLKECRFPLFDFLKPLPLAWMYIVYLLMLLAAFGIMLGFVYRLSCLTFVITYWYILLLDKTLWNNHSYLYGLCGFILLVVDGDRYFSMDSWLRPDRKNCHVPLWNYTLFRTQFFLVYFMAGLKKIDLDWIMGYSMESLSHHWIFAPMKYFLTPEQIDLFVIHHGGLIYDLSVGYLLFFDRTRPIGIFLSLMFHGMNSMMFAIGMFPYAMIATLPVFCHADWPKQLITKLPNTITNILPSTSKPRFSAKCIYQSNLKKKPGRFSVKNHICAMFTIIYIAMQVFMPYSHFITKGYNSWTNGLYGYSWDMMVHTWSTQHMRITYVNKETGESGFLRPDAWTRGHIRWSSHPDMIKQYATCIKDRLKEHNIYDVALYFDIWRSLNDRFQQRMFDPHVDMVTAPWSPFRKTPWLMPLLMELSDWRKKMDEIEKDIYGKSNETDVVFMADFPGLIVENYVQSDLDDCRIQVLRGEVILDILSTGKNKTLRENDVARLPTGEYHNVHTVSDTPSSFVYLYVNVTERKLQEELHRMEEGHTSDTVSRQLYEHVVHQKQQIINKANTTVWDKVETFFTEKAKLVVRSATMTGIALRSLVTGQDFEALFNSTMGMTSLQ